MKTSLLCWSMSYLLLLFVCLVAPKQHCPNIFQMWHQMFFVLKNQLSCIISWFPINFWLMFLIHCIITCITCPFRSLYSLSPLRISQIVINNIFANTTYLRPNSISCYRQGHTIYKHLKVLKAGIMTNTNMLNLKQHAEKVKNYFGKFEKTLSQEEERKRWKLSRDLSVGCPNPTQDRQHFQIPDKNYMSTF